MLLALLSENKDMFVATRNITRRFSVFAQLGQLWRMLLGVVVPGWSAGTQVHMDVSGRILRTWMPAVHAGMTM